MRSDRIESVGGGARGASTGKIGETTRGGESGRVGYKVSENVRVVAPNAEAKSVIVRSGAHQAAEENLGNTTGRIASSSPVRGANMGKPYPGTKSSSAPADKLNVNRSTPKDNARALKAAQSSKGTQAGHAVTDNDNHTRPVNLNTNPN